MIDSRDRLPAEGPCWMSAVRSRVHVQPHVRLMKDGFTLFRELTDYENAIMWRMLARLANCRLLGYRMG